MKVGIQGEICTWRWSTEKLCGAERLKVEGVVKVSAHWSFLPKKSRFGKREIRIWMKKPNNSVGWLRPCVVVRGIDSGKDLHPNYLLIQRTGPVFSRNI